EPRIVFLQLKRVWSLRRNMQEIPGIERNESVSSKHFHLSIQAMKQFRNFLVQMLRNRHPRRTLSQERYEDSVTMRVISEDRIQLVASNHALALARSKNKRNRTFRSSRGFG